MQFPDVDEMEKIDAELKRAVLDAFTLKDRLEGLSPEERLEGLSPEERRRLKQLLEQEEQI